MSTVGVLALVVSLLPAAAPQKASAGQADLRELASYTLTMDVVTRLNRALVEIATGMKKDPKVQELQKVEQEIDTLKKKDETTEAEDTRIEQLEARHEALEAQIENPLSLDDVDSFDAQAAKLQKYPAVVATLRANGFTPREYAKAFAALLQASMAAGLQKSGVKQIPEGTNPANVKFVIDHEADLQKMQQAWAEKK